MVSRELSVQNPRRLTAAELATLQQEDARKRIKEALKRRIGRGGVPAKQVAAMAGHPNTDRLYTHADLLRDTAPSGEDFVRYGGILGPGFVNEVFAPYGMGGMRWLDGSGACPVAFGQTVVGYLGTHLQASSDGVLDHVEMNDLSRLLVVLGSGAYELHARLSQQRGALILR